MQQNKRLPTLHAVLDDFSTAPFRLLFLSACIGGILASLSWTFSTLGLSSGTDPLNLHLFLFLQSFAGTSFCGFLLTAIPEWTHYTGKLKKITQIIWGIWLIATVAVFFSLTIALLLMLLLWLIITVKASQMVWIKRDSRHTSVLIWLLVYLGMSAYISVAAWQGKPLAFLWQQMLHIGTLGIALVSFRIGKALGEQALEDAGQADSRFIPNPFYKNLSIWLFYSLIVSNLALRNSVFEGWLSLAVAGVMIGRLREWHFSALLKAHYVRWLYLTLTLIGIGYAWRGIALIGGDDIQLNPITPLHLIAIGGFLLMSYQVFNIAGLRHSNIALIFPKATRFALFLIVLAGICRSLLVELNWPYQWVAIYLPGGLLALALLIYIPVFYRLFSRHSAVFPSAES